MIIRATAKLLNVARIKPINTDESISITASGEWYATLVSTRRKGSLAIYFLHNPSMMSIIVMGKSLNKSVLQLPSRVTSLLKRNKFHDLIPLYDFASEPIIYKTNSRSVLAIMNQLKSNIEYHLAMSENLDPDEIDKIEDIHLNVLLGGKIGRGSYIRPLEILGGMRAK